MGECCRTVVNPTLDYYLVQNTPTALVKKVRNPPECTLTFLYICSSTAGVCFSAVLTEYLFS